MEAGLLTFPCIYIYHTLLFLKQNIDPYQNPLPKSNHYTRNKNKFNIPPHKTSFFKRQMYYNAVIFFNALPDYLKVESDDRQFKRRLRDLLVNKCYYSIKDFVNNL